jgi:hypothetical protein
MKNAKKTAKLTLARGEPPGAGNRRTTNLEYREPKGIGQPGKAQSLRGDWIEPHHRIYRPTRDDCIDSKSAFSGQLGREVVESCVCLFPLWSAGPNNPSPQRQLWVTVQLRLSPLGRHNVALLHRSLDPRHLLDERPQTPDRRCCTFGAVRLPQWCRKTYRRARIIARLALSVRVPHLAAIEGCRIPFSFVATSDSPSRRSSRA